MSLKRTQDTQGGGDRYGGQSDQPSDMSDKPQQATMAQMARRKLAQPRKPSGSNRSSRAGTPTAPSAFPQQQSMPSFMSSQGQSGGDGGFNFTAGGGSGAVNNPFSGLQQNGTGTPPPMSFGQNGGGMFGGNTGNSFGSSFSGNNNASQPPQQNGFNPSANSSIFSDFNANNNNNNNTPSFGGFGQSNQNTQSQQNGVTPSTATTATFSSFGQQNQQNNDKPANPFANFKVVETPQQTQQTQSTPSTSFGGSNSQQPNGDKTQATPSFGGFGSQQSGAKSNLFGSTSETPKPSTSLFTTDTPKPTTNLFGSGTLGQMNGASKPEETPAAKTSSLFSGLQQNGTSKGLFGSSTAPQEERPMSPGGSVLTGLDSARASTVKTGMFTQNNNTSETPKSNLFSFGQQHKDDADETPKASSNLFGAAKTNGTTSNLFSGLSNTTSHTPAKQTSNLFSSSLGQQPQQNSSAPSFTCGQTGQSQQDTSMTTPGNTPQKPNNLFAQPQSQSQSQPPATEQPSATSDTPAGQGKSLFDRVSYPDPPATQTPKPSFTPSTSMFTGANNKENETPAASNMFQQTPSTQPQQTSFTPSTSLFSKPAAQASQTPSAAPWLSHAAAATPAAPTTTITPATPQPPATVTKASAASSSTDESLSQREVEIFKELNGGLLKHLNTQDVNADWSAIMHYYLKQAAKIRNKPAPMFDAPVSAQAMSSAPPASEMSSQNAIRPQGLGSSSQATKPSTPSINLFSSASTPKPPPSNSTNLFAAAQTPNQPAVSSQLSKPLATAPVNRKRPGPFTEEDDDEDQQRGPATEKRARHNEPINYPKLPDNASNASKLMESIINTPKKGGSEQQDALASTFGGFKPSTSTSNTASQPAATTASAGGFKPSTSAATTGSQSTTAPSGGFTPANSGLPKFSPTAGKSGGFLASFGKQAKRKAQDEDDDYDSDEGDDAWEKKYQEKQAAKRKKLMKESSGTSFVFNAAASKPSAAASVFSLSATPSEASDNEADDDKADGEKAQGTGDNTWQPKTPIKFGASTTGKENASTTPAVPPPTFGNLFGSATGSSSLLSVPGANKPSMNFNFASNPASSTGTSRASTPGATTDGENSTAGNDDDDESQADPQVEDQTGLSSAETKDEDVLLTIPTATAKKIKTKKDPDAPGGVTKSWAVVGNGPIYVLKNRNTGTARILQKIAPMGTAKMNFPMLPKMNYEVAGKKKQLVQGAFFDHLDEPKNPRVAMYALDVGADYAADLAKVLNENKPKDKDGDE